MLVEAAPAKLNLSLAVTGKRPDGFHELLSLIVSLSLSDHLAMHVGQPLSLTCDDASLPVDETNLVMKAVQAYRRYQPDCVLGRFHLTKKIPHGAGLGGGSSDAAATLRLLDRAAPSPLGFEKLEEIAALVGSDCPYFIRGQSAIMRGRGERLEPLPEAARQVLLDHRVWVIKPPFGISTPEAYAALADSGTYQAADRAQSRLAAWLKHPSGDPSVLGNDLQPAVFFKHLALSTVSESLLKMHGVAFRLTGSGSACFALVSAGLDAIPVFGDVKKAWGPGAWMMDTRISA
ncbi:MAG: 4-(cytidine 5'-diphospho)-2-C-methyl-D-erythritol kinase [Verrucomicrobiota bacterium]